MFYFGIQILNLSCILFLIVYNEPQVEGRKAILKLEAGKAFRRKDYGMALAFYDSVSPTL
jgi:hypothetical protein